MLQAFTWSILSIDKVGQAWPDAPEGLKVLQLANWGAVTWSTFNNSFSTCSNMVITATDSATAVTGAVTDFHASFAFCSSLTSFPLIDTKNVTDFSFAWNYCSAMTSFAALDTGNATTFRATWQSCSGLRNFPRLNSAKVTNFRYSWWNNASLVDFPQLDTSKGGDCEGAWSDCTSLSIFPAPMALS